MQSTLASKGAWTVSTTKGFPRACRSCSSTDATPRTVYTRLLPGLETMAGMRFPAANLDSGWCVGGKSGFRLVRGGFQLTRTCDL
jgi:hypothetical protein